MSNAPALQCRHKFLRFFPEGFADPKYLAWERDYKIRAHEKWRETLSLPIYEALLKEGCYQEIAARAVRLESATNLLFSFEKMALRDALRSEAGARIFSEALFEMAYGETKDRQRFERFAEAVGALPRRQTRVLTWPLLTVFGFLALPKRDIFLKPMVTRKAAGLYGFEFAYQSKPNWETYASLLGFARVIKKDLADLKPRDMVDVQSFIWVLGSSEYDE